MRYINDEIAKCFTDAKTFSIDKVLSEVSNSGISDSRVGRFIGDPNLVLQIRKGRVPSFNIKVKILMVARNLDFNEVSFVNLSFAERIIRLAFSAGDQKKRISDAIEALLLVLDSFDEANEELEDCDAEPVNYEKFQIRS